MLPLALLFVLAGVLLALAVRVVAARRCRCQRDEPLASLAALGVVTAEVRRQRRR